MTSGESQFYKDAENHLDALLEEAPVTATFLGDHRFDGGLGDYTREGEERQRAMWADWERELHSFATQGWSLDARIDHTLTTQLVKSFLRGIDRLRLVERNPSTPADEVVQGAYLLILRDFAPLPQRMGNLLGRLREAPRVFAEGRSRIVAKDVPPLWAEMAIESAEQSVGFFGGFIPAIAEAVPTQKTELVAAAQSVAKALREHAAWIRNEVQPRAAGDFATGKPLFEEILREDHMVDYNAEELLSTGWRLLDETRAEMERLAARMDKKKTARALIEASKADHPSAEGLLDAYRTWMAKARQFVVDREIATIPAGETLRIDPTPPFLRPILPYAAYQMPGFLERVQEGVFVVTPVEEGASVDAAERKLRGHPWAAIPVTALHEAYPGHHLQLVAANQTGTLPRKMGAFLSSLFVEGWAFYCEELMEELGFIGEPIQKLTRLQAQMWRAARIVLDVSLHTGTMDVEEAVRFLVEKANLESEDAQAEVRRYTQAPTQPQCYLMGKLEILEIVAAYRKAHPEASLRETHDAILSCGSLPPRLMRDRLFPAG
jgi:uncharacterized protein (DUF885 family)